ncbi:MAG: PilN domain-containing protein [Kistimonas sp.]|nr:PilN domain-containing protein [Kistimonas sp.]
MATINLLPWREEQRREEKRHFLGLLVAAFAMAVLLIFLRSWMINSAIDVQQARNNFLQKGIDELDQKIKDIGVLKESRTELLARIKVIQGLQGNRPVIVRVFDELVRVVPDGVYLARLSMEGNQIELEGVAVSNRHVSRLMRQLDGSLWFDNPGLTNVRALDDNTGSSFELVVTQVSPTQARPEEVTDG